MIHKDIKNIILKYKMSEYFDIEEDKNTIRLGIFGQSGRGKTWLACSLLKDERMLRNKFDEIFLLHPEYDGEPLGQNWNSIHINYIYTMFSQELVEQIVAHVKEKFLKNRNYRALLILDDCVSDDDFSNKQRTEIGKCFTNSRKFGLSLMIISQRMSLIPQTIHSQLNYVILFKTMYGKELKTIYDSYGLADKKKWSTLLKHCFQNKRDTLMIDVDNNCYYRNFNPLEIKD